MSRNYNCLIVIATGFIFLLGCSTAGQHREKIDQTAYKIIEQKQMEAIGKTEPFSIESPQDTLRRRLMLEQNLPYSNPASLNTKDLEPIDHWPKDDYLDRDKTALTEEVFSGTGPIQLSLIDALQIAAKNNRQYQSMKENVFVAALGLDLERDEFRNTFAGAFSSDISANLGGDETTSGIQNSGAVGLSRRFLNGISLTTQIGMDLVKLLNPFSSSSYSLFGDASISIPLMRGSGKHIVAEPLIQAERDALYAIYDFEQYKRQFAVNITEEYLVTLQAIDRIENDKASYESSVTSTRLSRRKADAGLEKVSDVDLAIQREFSSRTSWIRSQFQYQDRLDSLKIQLGLPPDVQIELDRDELMRLTASAQSIIESATTSVIEEEVPPADAPANLKPISRENAGPMELEEDIAIQLALDNRLDLRIALGNLYDARRRVVIAADALRAEFTLLGNASFGETRSLGSADNPSTIDPNFEKGRYNALLNLDLPLERTREIISYRQSIINLERAVRDYQELEDSIKMDIRSRLRNLHQNREQLIIEAQSVAFNERREKNQILALQAGRVTIRDVVDSQDSLVSAQNSLTDALVSYRLSELRLQQELDLLQIDPDGLWKEISPEELKNERQSE
ncbi:MAG: TolC family protein [Candidatus Omnitrophica bacterium]|nr:TolC family protein [Candidatus Omnitrophota bacterium]